MIPCAELGGRQEAHRIVDLVGAVGIEFIKAQNLKELCGMC